MARLAPTFSTVKSVSFLIGDRDKSMNTRLNFINRLSALAKADGIVLPDELVPNVGEMIMARRAIRNCGSVCRHPFFYADDQEIVLSVDWVDPSRRGAAMTVRSLAASPVVWPIRSWKAKS